MTPYWNNDYYLLFGNMSLFAILIAILQYKSPFVRSTENQTENNKNIIVFYNENSYTY